MIVPMLAKYACTAAAGAALHHCYQNPDKVVGAVNDFGARNGWPSSASTPPPSFPWEKPEFPESDTAALGTRYSDKNKAWLNARMPGSDGAPRISAAIARGDKTEFDLIMRNGPDLTITDADRRTPFDYAKNKDPYFLESLRHYQNVYVDKAISQDKHAEYRDLLMGTNFR